MSELRDMQILSVEEVADLAVGIIRGVGDAGIQTPELEEKHERLHAWAQEVRLNAAMLEGLLAGRMAVSVEGEEDDWKWFAWRGEGVGQHA